MESNREVEVEVGNLVGIIPVSGHETFDFDQPWPNCMMPIAPSYSLLEAAVAECAWAGCKSIWIVINDDIAPFVKKAIGDWCDDPVWAFRTWDRSKSQSRRRIPIYYTAVNPKDRHRRDCLSWTVLHGAVTAFKILEDISSWLTPSKYYVSFPHGYFPPEQLREHRKIINSNKNVYISFNENTVKQDFFTSFTFGKEDWLEFRRVIRTGTGRKVPGSQYDEDVLLPPEERWSARFFPLSKVFGPLNLDQAHKIEVDDFYNVRNWEEYVSFISYTRQNPIKRPNKNILRGTKANKLDVD